MVYLYTKLIIIAHRLSVIIIQALASVGAIFSGTVGGWIADRWGRKCSLMFTGVPYMTGYLILSYAHYSTNATIFKILLFGGRFMTGVAMGSSSVVVAVSDHVTGITMQ